MSFSRSLSLLAVVVVSATSCHTPEFVPPPMDVPQEVPGAGSGPASSAPRQLAGMNFRFRDGDRVGLTTYASDGKILADGTVQLGNTGRVELPIVGQVGLSSLRALDALVAVDAAYRRALYKQDQFGSRSHIHAVNGTPVVLVRGRVAVPGVVPYKPGLTIREALEKAGADLEKVGATSRVFLYRNGRRTQAPIGTPEGMSKTLEAGDLLDLPPI